MKADILTIHFGVNYGSCLQVYALSSVIKKNGYNCEVINYVPKRYDSWEVYGRNKIGKYPLLFIIIWYVFTTPKREYQRWVFKKFLHENLTLTKRYKYPIELKNDAPKADLYIVGSDQIWNYDYNTLNDYSYMLDFIKDKKIKFSYAASIGKSQITESEKEIFVKYLNNFNKITVREKSAKKMLADCNIDSEVVLDPTFLLKPEEWRKLSKPLKHSKDYILVYVMDNLHEKLIDIAEKIKKKYDSRLKIYVITFVSTKDKRVDKEFHNLNPRYFLSLIDNAKYIVTNSFHGTAFSINFNKQFISVGKEKYNSRIKDLLETLELERYFIKNNESLEMIDELKPINYLDVNKKLDNLRKDSMLTLRSFFK